MENKNLGIAITIITVLLCGLPGLLSSCAGGLVAINSLFLEGPRSDLPLSLGLLFTGLIFLAVPIVAGIFIFRKRKPSKVAIQSDEPIPPPS